MMIKKPFAFLQHPYASIASNQALRYAILCTISISFSGAIGRWLHLSMPIFLFFVLSSACSIYFSYGVRLFSQSLMITAGSILIAICCGLAITVSPHLTLSLVFLFIVSLISYYYSTLNIGWWFVSKLGLVMLAFAVVGGLTKTSVDPLSVMLAVILGGGLALLINMSMYMLSLLLVPRHYESSWHRELYRRLTQLSRDPNSPEKTQLINELDHYKAGISAALISHFLLIDRITHALQKYTKVVHAHPMIITTLSIPLQELFKSLARGFKEANQDLIKTGMEEFTHYILSLREEGFFENLETSVREQYVECVFLLNKLGSDLSTYHEEPLLKEELEEERKSFDLPFIITKLKQHRVFTKRWKLTLQSKIALRAAIAISLSYAVALLFNLTHPAWIILSTNLVLLVRKGDTIKKILDRVLGHGVGAVLALPFGYIIWPYFSSVYFWTPLLGLSTAYYFLKNYFIYAILLMIIILYLYMMMSLPGVVGFPVYSFTLNRLIDVTIGCFIALTVSLLVFPRAGTTPLMTMHTDMLGLCRDTLAALCVKTGMDMDKILVLNAQLGEQLAACMLAQKSLSFQPERYMYNRKTQQHLLNFEIEFVEQLGSLIRRIARCEHAFINQEFLHDNINQFLSKMQWIISLITESVVQAGNKDKLVITDNIVNLTKDLQVQLELASVKAFSLSDTKAIDYDELISYLGVLFAIQQLRYVISQFINHKRG